MIADFLQLQWQRLCFCCLRDSVPKDALQDVDVEWLCNCCLCIVVDIVIVIY